MITSSEEELICDLAETYGIFDYKALPSRKLAVLCCGLRENSRVKMKQRHEKVSMDTIFLASIVDKLSILIWQRTKDGIEGKNAPEAILGQFIDLGNIDTKGTNVCSFDSAEEFEQMVKEIKKGKNYGD